MPSPLAQDTLKYGVYVCNGISMSKAHFGSMGASKNKLKDTKFDFPMTDVT